MALKYSAQPYRSIYLAVFVTSFLFVRLPIWLVVSVLPAWRPRCSWSYSRTIRVKCLQAFTCLLFESGFEFLLPPPLGQGDKPSEETGFVWFQPARAELIQGAILELAQRNEIELAVRRGGYWYGKRFEDGSHEKVLYVLHSGAFVLETAAPSGGTAVVINSFLASSTPFRCAFAVEYRLSSTKPYKVANPWPAALIDVIAGYDYLLGQGIQAENIVVAGDSAGASLALALTRYITRMHQVTLPVPGALLLLSPVVDWTITHTGVGSAWTRNRSSELILAAYESMYTVDALRGSLTRAEISMDPYINPGSQSIVNPVGMFTGLPRTLIIACDAEGMLDGMRTLRSRIAGDIGQELLTFVEIKDASHNVIAQKWHEPERSVALRIVQQWLCTM